MSRNTKEVALIQHRSGNLAEMPKALHQAEIGLAKDANRLFIGNAVNTILANRTEFPYQNLEILTEYSDLRDHFRYAYENNITNVIEDDENVDRAKLKEFMPIVITCNKALSTGLPFPAEIEINSVTISLAQNDTAYDIADKINAEAENTNTYVTVLPTKIISGSQESTAPILTFVCLDSELVVNDPSSSGILTQIGFPLEVTYDISMPERKVTEKLDDTLYITDFGIRGDGTSRTKQDKNISQEIFNSLVEVYKNYDNTQFYRDVLFPAGTYLYEPNVLSLSDTITVYAPFPMISNLHIHGEGIDRTIIKTVLDIPNDYVLLNSIDNQVNPSSSGNYGESGYPNNILIEDITFDSSASGKLCVIDGITNITFNRVKFVGDISATLVDIIGTGTHYASNITFNECIFEGGAKGIYIEEYAENVTITNCTFDGTKECAVKLGNEEHGDLTYVRAVTMNGNTIKNFPSSSNSSIYALEICRNVTYASIHQTQFENALFQNWKNNAYPRPYKYSSLNTHGTNFIDTLDPTTDEKKVLKFKFSQPKWEYLDYLINQQGKKVLVVDGNDADVTAPNGLHIKESASSLDIRAVGTDASNVKISIENDSDLILGSATDTDNPVTGNIQIEKTLKLNDNDISNETGSADIIIKTASNKVIEVSQKPQDDPYAQLIQNKLNALANVDFVKRQVIDTYEKVITYKDIANISSGALPLITFDPNIYGNFVYLKRIILNVRTPFYKTFGYISKAVNYSSGHTYYAGDIVSGTENGATVYAAVINTHKATNSNVSSTNTNLQQIPNQPSYKDVKYANVLCDSDILTQTYIEDYRSVSSNTMYYPDIQMNNRFGYVNCDEVVNNYSYGGGEDESSKLVQYCERNYLLPYTQVSTTYNPIDLHNATDVRRKIDEGYNYMFEMDRDYNNGEASQENPATKNYSSKTLRLAFYDKDKTQISTFNNAGQLNPGGKLLVRIEFLRTDAKVD